MTETEYNTALYLLNQQALTLQEQRDEVRLQMHNLSARVLADGFDAEQNNELPNMAVPIPAYEDGILTATNMGSATQWQVVIRRPSPINEGASYPLNFGDSFDPVALHEDAEAVRVRGLYSDANGGGDWVTEFSDWLELPAYVTFVPTVELGPLWVVPLDEDDFPVGNAIALPGNGSSGRVPVGQVAIMDSIDLTIAPTVTILNIAREAGSSHPYPMSVGWNAELNTFTVAPYNV